MEHSPFNPGHDPQNLLIAEDRPEIQILMKKLMDMWGHTADIVGNGLEAVEHARTGSYDLCLMDRHMPVMNGIKAIEEIRKETPYFPIIMYSLDNPPSESLLLSLGIDEWIDKNTGPGYLRERIKEWGGIRTYSVVKEGEDFVIKKEMPMDAKHAEEIKQLKVKGLVKVRIGTNGEDLILHKNTTNKISHDFIAKGHMLSVFINHDPERPTRCELYKQHCHITQTYLDPADYKTESNDEMKEMESYSQRTVQPEMDDVAD